MDNRPIGIFDSGLGGLTCVREVMKIMPNENIIYFGDTGRVPYGTRSSATIVKYVRQDINFLRKFDIKFIVIACGTASSAALPHITTEYDTDIIGVVEPALKIGSECYQKRTYWSFRHQRNNKQRKIFRKNRELKSRNKSHI